jgi:hypothetical protein
MVELMANNSSIRKLADGTAMSNETQSSWIQLQAAICHWEIEFATLVDANTSLIIANGNNNRSSQFFNPSNIVDAVVKSNERVVCTIVMSYEEFLKEGAPSFV